MRMRTWVRNTYTVEMTEYDNNLKAFEVRQGNKIQTIYPSGLENMYDIITDLDIGEDVNGWNDGLGNTIIIE